MSASRYTWTRLPRSSDDNGINQPDELSLGRYGYEAVDVDVPAAGEANNSIVSYCQDCVLPMSYCSCSNGNSNRTGNKKRSRDEEEVMSIPIEHYGEGEGGGVQPQKDEPANSSICATRINPNKKQRRTKKSLVAFASPHPCGFGSGGCRFRLSCSYHHGDPTPCDCNDASCDRGHAHRRPPRLCDHGTKCRWNQVLECSFHHGIPEPCECRNKDCLKAHLRRTTKQKKERRISHENNRARNLEKRQKKKSRAKAKQQKQAARNNRSKDGGDQLSKRPALS